MALAAFWFVGAVDPGRAGELSHWVSATVLLVLLPVLGAHWLIGFVIYLNHTHPDIVWYQDPREWSRDKTQIEGSAGVNFRRYRHVPLPHRIMNHTAHHVDPGVPLRELGQAQQHLLESFGDRMVSVEWSPRQFGEVLRSCKLYDYQAKRWLTYDAAGESG